MTELNAQDFFLSEDAKGCAIEVFKDGKLTVVPSENFLNMPLKATPLRRNPEYLGFTFENQKYIAPKKCLKARVRTATKPTVVLVDKYFLEFELGLNKVTDQNQVPVDYNNLFPSTGTSQWGISANSSYKTKQFFQIGFGIAATPVSYYVLKFRMFKGEKTDSVRLTELNTGLYQDGSWNYSDLFLNAYFGYKVVFVPHSSWKIMIGGYVGVSNYSSNLSDGTNAFELKSFLLPVFLFEGGPEYRLEEHIAVGVNIGYEYLGRRSLSSPTVSNIKTKMNYTNTYETLALKYYF